MADRPRQQPPMAPKEGWISDGRQVLHFKPARWDRWAQELELTVGEWIPGESVPLLKRRQRMSRKEALSLWQQKRQQGWKTVAAQWTPPSLREGRELRR